MPTYCSDDFFDIVFLFLRSLAYSSLPCANQLTYTVDQCTDRSFHSQLTPTSTTNMSAADIIRKQHQREALACLEDGGQPLISPPSEVVIDTTLVDLGMGVSPPRRRGRRDSDRFKTMSMVSSLGFGTTSPGFTGTNVTTWDFGQWQYGCYDNFNVVNQRASQAFASPGISSPVCLLLLLMDQL